MAQPPIQGGRAFRHCARGYIYLDRHVGGSAFGSCGGRLRVRGMGMLSCEETGGRDDGGDCGGAAPVRSVCGGSGIEAGGCTPGERIDGADELTRRHMFPTVRAKPVGLRAQSRTSPHDGSPNIASPSRLFVPLLAGF
jgi:hypothetical protein